MGHFCALTAREISRTGIRSDIEEPYDFPQSSGCIINACLRTANQPFDEPSHLFHFAEEALDDIAHCKDIFIMRDGLSGIAL